MTRPRLLAAAALLTACTTTTLPEYAAARKAALAPPPAVEPGWKPDAVLVLSGPLVERLVDATLPVYGTINDRIKLDNGVIIEPDLRATDATLTGSAACEACLAVDVRVVGTLATSSPIRVRVPVDVTVGLDFAVEGKTVKSAHIVTITPKDVRRVSVQADALPSQLRQAIEQPLRDAVRQQLVERSKPFEAARFPADGMPLQAVRAAGSRSGVRVELRTGANTPTPLTAATDKVRDGWAFAIQQDSLVDLARAQAMRQGVVYYDVVPEPTGLRVGRGTFELDLRLWKTTGQGWWRDYVVHGTLTRGDAGFSLAPASIVEGATSEGAALADPLAELGRSQILANIEAGIAGSLAASHSADLEGGLKAEVEVRSVYGVGDAMMVTGDLTVRAAPRNRSAK